ncbi:hypothetical protein GM556_01390 [Bombella sp. ESL0378]|uniref:S41 family peptidase n=1 Tax=Bombella sp. ESL0378 TaxID=2676442 RepID=UPI0012D8EC0A|nr:S41 family peptidase [Bombella sp. ESL0378]MUG04201.1 hypothetical protein [Bombella sp. ESL0378]
MMSARCLRSLLMPPALLTLCGALFTAGLTSSASAQAASSNFWRHFIQRLTPDAQTHPHISSQKTPSSPLSSPAPAITPPPPPITLDAEDQQTQQTLAAALTFMMPRLLTPQTPQNLCLWGMHALVKASSPLTAHINLTLTIEPTSHTTPSHLTLFYGSQRLLDEPTPHKDDILGWSQLSTRFIATLRHSLPNLYPYKDETCLTLFLNGLLTQLDPYSRYQPPTHTTSPPTPPQTIIASVGLTLRQSHAHFPAVAAINLNSPLWDAGITPGDRLISINHHSTRNTPLKDLQKALTGPKGSTIQLSFRLQDGQKLTRNFTLSLMGEESVFPDHIGHLPLLHVTQFLPHTAEEISQYLSAFFPPTTLEGDLPHASPPKTHIPSHPGLVLDLRGNHGGILQQAVMTAALFLDHGVITTTDGRAPESNHVWSIQGGDLTNNTALALLVDKNTGSAAEILAAALADHHRAIIIGSSSFGKGMVQISTTLPNGGHLALSWARLNAPQGWSLQGLGVIPSICTTPQSHYSLKAQFSALQEGHSLMATTLQQAHLIHEDSPADTRLALRAICPPSPPTITDLSTALTVLSKPHFYQAALFSTPTINAP